MFIGIKILANWSNTALWFLGSGGTGGHRNVGGADIAPLPQDNVFFDASSFSTTGRAVHNGYDKTWSQS